MESFNNLAGLFNAIGKECEKVSIDVNHMMCQITTLEGELNKERERNQKLKNILLDLVEVLND